MNNRHKRLLVWCKPGWDRATGDKVDDNGDGTVGYNDDNDDDGC